MTMILLLAAAPMNRCAAMCVCTHAQESNAARSNFQKKKKNKEEKKKSATISFSRFKNESNFYFQF